VSVLGTGTSVLPRGFSRRHGCRDSPAVKPAGIAPRVKRRGGFPYRDWLRACPRTTIAWVPLPFLVTPSVIADATWYGNINPFAIGYASRPRLRSRLTLRRRTLLRKPWTIGGGDSHPSRVTHAGILTSCRSTTARAPASQQQERSPTDRAIRRRLDPTASEAGLSPVEFSAPEHLTSELLRTLSRMAASKPTSWLSRHSDIVLHLAST
jgi:hypothetical protein